MLQNENTALHHPSIGLDTIRHIRSSDLNNFISPKHYPNFAYSRVLEPMPVLELVPELDPVLGLEVASEPELKPVPVLELELGFVEFQRRSPECKFCSLSPATARRRHPSLV